MNGVPIEETTLAGLIIVRPKIFRDARGFFFESYNRDTFSSSGISTEFVQDNHSRSSRGTLRGLHFQKTPGQIKMVRCTLGKIWDVAVDIRPGSPTLGKHFGIELSPENATMLYIPIGFAHGFLVLSDVAEVQYKCSAVYNSETEAGFRWNDATTNIPWPLAGIVPILSERDQNSPAFAELISGLIH